MQDGDRSVGGSGRPESRRVFTTEELFGAAAEIEIVHEDAAYRLRITRQGKLILTK